MDGNATTPEELHQLLCEEFRRILENGDVEKDDEGKDRKIPASAAKLKEIRQFLADNNITGVPAPKSPLGDLAAKLPFTPKE